MERKLVEIPGGQLEVVIGDGRGPTVCAAHPADTFTEETVRLLEAASGARVVCLNPRGLGASSPAPAQTLEQMVDDLEAARLALGERRWIFWGMSGGGWLAELHAAKYPQAIAGLILESACACFRARLADPSCVLSPYYPAWQPALAAHGLIDRATHDDDDDDDDDAAPRVGEGGPCAPEPVAGGFGNSPRVPETVTWSDVAGVGAVFRRRGGPALLVSPMALAPRMRETMPALWAADLRPRLAAITAPTLVLCGTADPVVPLAHARRARGDPRSSLRRAGGRRPRPDQHRRSRRRPRRARLAARVRVIRARSPRPRSMRARLIAAGPRDSRHRGRPRDSRPIAAGRRIMTA